MRHAQSITDQPLLLRLDGGNDSIDNIDVILEHSQSQASKAPVDFIIKWYPRKEEKEEWLAYAEKNARWAFPHEGKRIALFDIEHKAAMARERV